MDLIDIVSANTIEELKQLVYSLKNLNHETLKQIFRCHKDLNVLKEECFHSYKSSLMSRERYYYNEFGFLDNNIRLSEYIKSTQELTGKEYEKIEEWKYIKKKEKSMRFIIKNFRPDISRAMFDAQLNYMTVEKDGVKLTSFESFIKLANEVNKYDIINCDDISSYSSFITYDGRYNTYKLERALSFAFKRNKKLRLDAIISPENAPSWIYLLKNNTKNQQYVFDHMLVYIDKLLSTIKEFNENNNVDIVDTIPLLNEPLNRHSGPFEAHYSLRKDVGLHLCFANKKWLKDENLRPGWMRILDIEHVCKLGTYIKSNSNAKLMINESYLEVYRKMQVFIEQVIVPIQKYEIENNVKIIDTIGTHLHVDVDVPVCDIDQSLETLLLLNIPIEVTSFDAYVAPDKISVASHQDITLYKSWYMHDLYKVFNKYSSILKCITIGSINDYMNFMVSVLNDKVYKENLYNQKHNLKLKPYYANVLGGYYDSQMNERFYLPEIGYQ